MDPALRRDSGTFYTPAGLVRDIVRAAVAAALEQRCGLTAADAAGWVYFGRPPARPPDLERLTILDPAVGSGAFLLGALDELVRLRRSVDSRPVAALRREVLSHSLYGVDLQPTAVRLTELRLWLALVQDLDISDVTRIQPLPNLDGHIRQGDTLLDPLAFAAALCPAQASARERVDRAADARRALFALAGPAKRSALNALHRAEHALARDLYHAAIDRLERAARALLSDARQPDLFGTKPGLDATGRRRLRDLRACRRELRLALRLLERDGGTPFFAMQSHFAEIQAAGGFDVVLGNPPWVRGERLPARVREALSRRYATWRPRPHPPSPSPQCGEGGRSRGFGHTPDLAVAFVERALELAAPRGVVALLVPAKLATSGYAAPLRQHVAQTATLVRAAPLDDRTAAAFGAVVYPMALVMTRAEATSEQYTATALGPPGAVVTVPQATLQGGGPWVLVPDAERVARRLGAELPTLGERWTTQLGVKTGADDLFVTELPAPHALPAARGRDVQAFRVEQRVFLYWTHDRHGRPLERLPADLARHFLAHEERLRRRADYRGGPPWQVYRTALARAPHRVVWADLGRTLAAAFLDPGVVPLNTLYGVATRERDEALALTALLNARWLTALARLAADAARGGFFRFNARVVSRLPLPRASSPGWAALTQLGARGETDDGLVRELLELDALDVKALDRLAPAAR
jgi:hypothetical protein